MKRPVRHSILIAAAALAFGEAPAAPATPEEIVREAIARDLPFDQLPRDENGRILSIESARALARDEADFQERFGRHYKAFFAAFTDAAIDWEAPLPDQSGEAPEASARAQARAGIEAASANPPWMPVAADAAGRLADQTGVVLDKIGTLGGYASMADAAMLHEAQGKGSATGHFAASVAREQAAGYAADKLSARFPKLGTFVELLDIYSDVTAEMEKEMDTAQARGGSLNSAKARGIINTIKKRTFIGTLEQALNEEGMAEVQNELATGHYSWSAVAYRTAATTIGEVTQMNAILRYGTNLHYGVYEAEKSARLETEKLKRKLQVKALSSDAGLEAMRHRMIQLQLHPHADSPEVKAELAQMQSRYDSGIKGMRELGKRMIRDFGADSTVVQDLYKRSQIARNAQRSELLEAKMARIAVARDEMDVRTWLELRDLRDDYRKELADFREATKRLHKERGSDDPLVRDMMNRFQAMRNASNAMDAVEFDAHAWRHREIDKDRAARERELQGYADLLRENAGRLPEGIRLEGESLDELVTEVDHLVMKQARGEVPADADLVALAAASHARELRYRELRAQQQAGLLPEDADLMALLDGPGEAEGDSPEAPPPAPETDASAFAGITDSGAATDMDESGLDTDAGEIDFTAVEVVTEPPPYVGDPIIGRNPDGSMASQRGEWEGHEHGATIRWKNGQMEIYAGMHRGQRHGPLRNYTNGVLTSESYFRDGKRHGPSRTWSAAGRLLGEYWFKEDGLHGWSRVYEEGQDNPYSEQLHVDRQLRVERLWTRDGEQMLSEKILAPDQTVLLERQWDPDTGILKSEVRRQHPPPASGLARTYRGLVGGSSDLYDERRWDAEGKKVGVQLAHKGSPPHYTVHEERYSESGDLEYRHTHVLGKGSLHESHYRSRDGKELRHGTWRDFFPERRDTLAFSPETVAEFRDGLAHGRYQRFHPNGKLREEGEFSQGLPHGTWREYDDKGVILSVSEFSNGQFNGIQKRYYTGELGREITVNGTTVTRFRSWHNGELMKDLEGVVGDPLQPRAIPSVEQRLNQIPRVPGFSGPKEELVTGKGRVWAINPSTKARVIQGEFELKDGKPHGRYRGYFWSGELRAEEHSRDGLRHGVCRSWLEDGRLEAEVTYVDGVMQGPGRWLDTRSGQYRELQMRDDVVVGWMIDHHPNGAVNRVLHYVPLSPEAAADPRRRRSTNYRSGPRNEYDFGPRIGPWAVFDDTGRQTGGGFWIIDDGKSRSVDAEAFSAWLAANPQYGQVPRTLPISPD